MFIYLIYLLFQQSQSYQAHTYMISYSFVAYICVIPIISYQINSYLQIYTIQVFTNAIYQFSDLHFHHGLQTPFSPLDPPLLTDDEDPEYPE